MRITIFLNQLLEMIKILKEVLKVNKELIFLLQNGRGNKYDVVTATSSEKIKFLGFNFKLSDNETGRLRF